MLAIGGQAPKAVRSVECYSFKEDRWTHLSDMPVRRCRCGVAVVQVQEKLKDFFTFIQKFGALNEKFG